MRSRLPVFFSLHALAAVLFPDYCASCKSLLWQKEKCICLPCRLRLPHSNFQKELRNRVYLQFAGRIKMEAACALYFFHRKGVLQKLVHQLKYKGRSDIGFYLGGLAGHLLKREPDYRKFDFLVPVPLHPAKQKKRGYNQAEVIARGISSVTGIPVNTRLLIRRQFTESQTQKGRYQRFENMRSVFELREASIRVPASVLLVDDIITTGSTLEAAALVLQDAGFSTGVVALAWAETR